MVLLVYVAIFAAVFFFRYRSMSGGSLGLKVDDSGRSYFLTLDRAGKRSPNFNVRIGLPVDEKLFFKIAPEGGLSRLLKTIGVAEEFQTGDHQTDKLLFVSDNPALFEDLMQAGNIRSAIGTLTALHGKAKLRAFGHRLWLEADNTPPGWLEKNREAILAQLWEIANAASKRAQMTAAHDTPRFSYAQRATFFMVLHATWLTGGIAGFMVHAAGDIEILNMTRFLMATLALVPLAAGCWIVLMAASLRRSMWLVMALGDFILVGIAGLALSVPLFALEVNRRAPQAPPVLYSQPLMSKSCSVYCSRKQGKNTTTRTYDLTPAECAPAKRLEKVQNLRRSDSTCSASAALKYKLHFAPFHEAQKGVYVLHATEAQFDEGNHGDLYDIAVHPGALGHAWLDQAEIRARGRR